MASPPATETMLAELEREVAPGLLTRDPSELSEYGRDWTKVFAPAPCAIALPRTREEVAAIVRGAAKHRVALVPSGGRTGLAAGAVATRGELVVSLSRMRAMGTVDELGATVRVDGRALAVLFAGPAGKGRVALGGPSELVVIAGLLSGRRYTASVDASCTLAFEPRADGAGTPANRGGFLRIGAAPCGG